MAHKTAVKGAPTNMRLNHVGLSSLEFLLTLLLEGSMTDSLPHINLNTFHIYRTPNYLSFNFFSSGNTSVNTASFLHSNMFVVVRMMEFVTSQGGVTK